ncbi:MAG: hypothetical protein SAK29_09295 [Scytonema sp. PMC 1069.18]|nr:hypothetical protein [Scytonema sp. PMC 1069.18]MEC4884489.1 hypothetical protein [Scytonema sp. PMC 1070.18]
MTFDFPVRVASPSGEGADLLIQIQIKRSRQIQSSNEAFQGLYISEEELEQLLAKPIGVPRWANATTPLSTDEVQTTFAQLAADIQQRKTQTLQQGITLCLEEIAS